MLSGSSINHSATGLRKLFGAAFPLGADGRLERPKGRWWPSGLTGSFEDRSPAAAVPVPELSLMFKDGPWLWARQVKEPWLYICWFKTPSNFYNHTIQWITFSIYWLGQALWIRRWTWPRTRPPKVTMQQDKQVSTPKLLAERVPLNKVRRFALDFLPCTTRQQAELCLPWIHNISSLS